MVQLLLQAQADLGVKAQYKGSRKTALDIAKAKNHLTIAALLEKGAPYRYVPTPSSRASSNATEDAMAVPLSYTRARTAILNASELDVPVLEVLDDQEKAWRLRVAAGESKNNCSQGLVGGASMCEHDNATRLQGQPKCLA